MTKKSAQHETVDLSMAEKIIEEYKGTKGSMIPVLQKIQEEYGYLQEAVVYLVAESLNVSASEVIGIATFYAQFHMKPRGKHIIRVCCGTACHVKNAKGLSAKVQDKFKLKKDETTEDKMFTLEEVSCLGACGIAPVVVVDKEVHGTLSPDKLDEILEEYKKPAA